MSTIAAALQIPTVAAPDAGAPVQTTGVTAASDDFILALTQALSSAAPAAAQTTVAASAVAPLPVLQAAAVEPEELTSEELASSLAGMLQLPWVPAVNAPAPAVQADPLESLGVTRGAPFLAGASARPVLDAGLQATLSSTAMATALVQDPLLREPQAQSAPAEIDASLLFNPTVDKPAAAQTSTPDVGPHSRPLHSNVGTQAWTEELGTRVTVMAERGQQSASIRLSPEHLGPLEVRIAIRDDQASVWFGAAHADTRAAIEHALPRLREMFEAQGMSLTDAGVSHEPPREQPSAPHQQYSADQPATEIQVTIPVVHRLGLIDAYA